MVKKLIKLDKREFGTCKGGNLYAKMEIPTFTSCQSSSDCCNTSFGTCKYIPNEYRNTNEKVEINSDSIAFISIENYNGEISTFTSCQSSSGCCNTSFGSCKNILNEYRKTI